MGARNPQTIAKRAREQAIKDRRERKRAKKAEAAAVRAAAKGASHADDLGDGAPLSDHPTELPPQPA